MTVASLADNYYLIQFFEESLETGSDESVVINE
jgi:hypothetical protein